MSSVQIQVMFQGDHDGIQIRSSRSSLGRRPEIVFESLQLQERNLAILLRWDTKITAFMRMLMAHLSKNQGFRRRSGHIYEISILKMCLCARVMVGLSGALPV